MPPLPPLVEVPGDTKDDHSAPVAGGHQQAAPLQPAAGSNPVLSEPAATPGPGEPGASHDVGLIYSIYRAYNPEKLPDVPQLLEKYKGAEAKLDLAICEK